MMFVLVLGAAFTFTSCGDDDDEIEDGPAAECTFLVDGEEYAIDQASYGQSADGAYSFAVGNTPAYIGIEIDDIVGTGANAVCEKIKLFSYDPSTGKKDESLRVRNANIYFVKDGSTFILKFADLKVKDNNGREATISLNYSGPAKLTMH